MDRFRRLLGFKVVVLSVPNPPEGQPLVVLSLVGGPCSSLTGYATADRDPARLDADEVAR